MGSEFVPCLVLEFTDHALERMQQRGFSHADVYLIVEYGVHTWRSKDRRVELADLPRHVPERLQNVVVVLDGCRDVVITVFRRDEPSPSSTRGRIERRGFTLGDALSDQMASEDENGDC